MESILRSCFNYRKDSRVFYFTRSATSSSFRGSKNPFLITHSAEMLEYEKRSERERKPACNLYAETLHPSETRDSLAFFYGSAL